MWLLDGLSSRYQRLAQGELGTDATSQEKGVVEKVKDVVIRSSGRMKGLVAAGVLFILVVLSWLFTGSVQEVPSIEVAPILPQARYLHLLVPAYKKSIPTCRLLVSAASNKFPTPNIITWDNIYNDSSLADSGAHLGKVRGVLDYFAILGPERDQDIVVIPDPKATIFQLRPDLMLERFMEVNRLAEERIKKRLGKEGAAAVEVHQKIIFAASKVCSSEADDAACYAVPGSPLSSRVYGSKTDTSVVDMEGVPHLYLRERYLSSNFMMGELKAIKTLYEKVNELLLADKAKATEQGILAKLFGEQEYARELERQKYLTFWQKTWKSLHIGEKSAVDPHPTHRKIDVEGAQLEYGIGLDYEGVLGSDTLSQKMMGWVSHNSSTGMEQLRKDFGVTATGSASLPDDIGRSVPPFWSRNPAFDGFPFELGWRDVNLYTNLWTGAIPASIHHSSVSTKTENVNKLTKTNWENVWFHDFARKKLNDYATEPDRPFTTIRGNGEEIAWWSIHRESWKLKQSKKWHEGEEKKEWIEWGQVCDGFEKEVFGDGKGDWKSPIDNW